MLTIAVFGSGRGSNFDALLSAMQRGTIPGARIALVVSNNSSAGILERARAAGIPAVHCSRPQFPTDDSYTIPPDSTPRRSQRGPHRARRVHEADAGGGCCALAEPHRQHPSRPSSELRRARDVRHARARSRDCGGREEERRD